MTGIEWPPGHENNGHRVGGNNERGRHGEGETGRQVRDKRQGRMCIRMSRVVVNPADWVKSALAEGKLFSNKP